MKGFFYYWIGQFGNSINNLDLAVDFAKAVENKELINQVNLMKAWINYDKGEFDLSRKYFSYLFDSKIPFSRIFYSFGTAFIALKEGQLDLAKAKLSEINSVLPGLSEIQRNRAKFYYDQLHSEILFEEGSIEDAINTCEDAASLGKPYAAPYLPFIEHNIPFLKDVLARICQQESRLNRAIAEYERLITFDPDKKERWLIHPKYYYRLGKLYEQRGDMPKAIKRYEKFLDLWRDADPGFPEVEDSKTRLAELKSRVP